MNEDCLTILSEFLSTFDTLRLKCVDSYYNLVLTADKFWESSIPLARPSWIPSNFIFVQKLIRRRVLRCMKCDLHLERFCVLVLCGCTGGLYPRWHPKCGLPTIRDRCNRSLGIVSCLLCGKKSMFVKVTSYP